MADIPALLLMIATFVGGTTALVGPPGGPAGNAVGRSGGATAADATLAARIGQEPTRPLVLARDPDGMFYVDGEIGEQRVRFLVDTGSNMVILSPYDAARLGIGLEGLRSTIDTAGGRSTGSIAYLPRLTVAGRQLRDVDAAVASTTLPVSLLGGNALSRLGEMRIKGATMTIG